MPKGKHRSRRRERKVEREVPSESDVPQVLPPVEDMEPPAGGDAPEEVEKQPQAPRPVESPPLEPPASDQYPVPPPQPERPSPEQQPPPTPGQPPPTPEQQPPPPPGQQPPGAFYPVPWYPYPFMPPGPGFGQPPQQPGTGYGQPPPQPVPTGQGWPPQAGQTGPVPVVPPPVVPLFAPGQQMPGAPVAPYPQAEAEPVIPPAMVSLEDEEFTELVLSEPGHWRGDLKWVFGIISALLLFTALLLAGAYRVTGVGASKAILVPLIREATEIEQTVEENYQDIRSDARRSKGSSIPIPDIGVSLSVSASEITSSSPEDLSEAVVMEVSRIVYTSGYDSDIPMMSARGAGEERAKAMVVTILGAMNASTHDALLWPMIILAVMAGLFTVVFIVFCRGWGKAIGLGVMIIAAALPASLFIRAGVEFFWADAAAGTYKEALFEALRGMGSTSVVFFDAALGLGALILVVGVIGNTISKRSRKRVPPFRELRGPREAVVGGPPLEPGLETTPPHDESIEREDEEAQGGFQDLSPPPGDSLDTPPAPPAPGTEDVR